MAVLIEGYSIVLNKAQALKKPEVLEALGVEGMSLHPMAICSDADLLRIGFLELSHAKEFIENLETAGLVYKVDKDGHEVAQDLVMITQFGELEVDCPWLSVQFTKLKDNSLVCLGTLKREEPVKSIAFPKNWHLEVSILKRFHEARTGHMLENYDLIAEEPMYDVYRNKEDQSTVRLLRLTYFELPKEQVQ